MAVAAGYSAPTEEELEDARAVPVLGTEMVEVFGVWPLEGQEKPPISAIVLSDVYGKQFIYDPDVPRSRPSDAQGPIVLTGPKRVITAFDCYILVNLRDGSENFTSDDVCRGHYAWVVDTSKVEFDKILKETVPTDYGKVVVAYAVWRDAVQALVRIKFVSEHGKSEKICGKIIAQTRFSELGSVLFDNTDDENIIVSSGEDIPIGRSAVAVPLIWPLIIDVDLHTSSGDKIVKWNCFYPETDGKQKKKFTGHSSHVEVQITWVPWSG